MKSNTFIRLAFYIVITIIVSLLPYFVFGDYHGNYSTLVSVIIMIGAYLSVEFLIFRRNGEENIRPYNVAIIGFPRSGKTTLIVSLFQEIFARKLQGINATLKGKSTIERLNSLMERKESGLPIGPTNDQTMFAFRTNITIKRKIINTEYKVEFGDYPGEYSEELVSTSYFDDLKKTEFFKWCIEANAYIFIIDVAQYCLSENKNDFIAKTSKSIRESWQHFLDYNSERVDRVRKKPTLLIFNKADLLPVYKRNNYTALNNLHSIIHELGFSETKAPETKELEAEQYSTLEKEMRKDFINLESYLESECKNFHVLFTSSYGTINNRLIGVQDILKYIFPKKLSF